MTNFHGLKQPFGDTGVSQPEIQASVRAAVLFWSAEFHRHIDGLIGHFAATRRKGDRGEAEG